MLPRKIWKPGSHVFKTQMLHLDIWITESLYAFFEEFKCQVRLVRCQTFTYTFDEDGVIWRNAETY